MQVRLALLTGLLLSILSVALVLFINVTATVTAPTTEDAGLPWNIGHGDNSDKSGNSAEASPILTLTAGNGGVGNGGTQTVQTRQQVGTEVATTPTPIPLSSTSPQVVSASDTVLIRQEVLGRLQFISVVGLGLVVLIGSLGAYWVARKGVKLEIKWHDFLWIICQ